MHWTKFVYHKLVQNETEDSTEISRLYLISNFLAILTKNNADDSFLEVFYVCDVGVYLVTDHRLLNRDSAKNIRPLEKKN
jgi:hypothetical protein